MEIDHDRVMTTRGPISPAELGVTDYHEHLYVEPPAWLHKIDPDFALNSVEKSAEELKTFAAAGGRTLCEMTAVDFGRNVAEDQGRRGRGARRSTSS